MSQTENMTRSVFWFVQSEWDRRWWSCLEQCMTVMTYFFKAQIWQSKHIVSHKVYNSDWGYLLCFCCCSIPLFDFVVVAAAAACLFVCFPFFFKQKKMTVVLYLARDVFLVTHDLVLKSLNWKNGVLMTILKRMSRMALSKPANRVRTERHDHAVVKTDTVMRNIMNGLFMYQSFMIWTVCPASSYATARMYRSIICDNMNRVCGSVMRGIQNRMPHDSPIHGVMNKVCQSVCLTVRYKRDIQQITWIVY